MLNIGEFLYLKTLVNMVNNQDLPTFAFYLAICLFFCLGVAVYTRHRFLNQMLEVVETLESKLKDSERSNHER